MIAYWNDENLPEGDPDVWVSETGHAWDLRLSYTDGAGDRWHWAGGFERVDDMWFPLFSRDDFSVTDVVIRDIVWESPEPQERQRPEHLAVLTVTVRFSGRYYAPGEMVEACRDWIGYGMTDRDDVREVEVSGHVIDLRSLED